MFAGQEPLYLAEDDRVVVAGVERSRSSQTVDIEVAVNVLQRRAASRGRRDRQPTRIRSGIRLPLALALQQTTGLRPGWRRHHARRVRETQARKGIFRGGDKY